jgi:FAD/FMN-containing dehydrogenase
MPKTESVFVYIGPGRDGVGASRRHLLRVIIGVDPDPGNAVAIKRWAVDYWEATHPYSAGTAYAKFMMDDEGQERVRATYGADYDRLAEVKAAYDPGNVFRSNLDIRHAG